MNREQYERIREAIRKAKKISKDMWDEISPLPFLMILRRLHELGQINQLQTDYRGRTSTIEYSLSSNVFEPAEDESDDNREEVVDDPNRTPTTK